MTSADSPARTTFDPAAMKPSDFYRVVNSVVVPRPIAWVCSRSAEGVHNLAPHSFYTVACVKPPVVQFTSVGRKDSLTNVEATGDFTVNLVPEELFEQANATGTDFPPDQSEAEHTGVRLEPSEKVAALRVAQSPVAIECTLHSTLRLGDSTVVFGRVEWISVWESAVRDGRPRIEELRPLARLGGNEWSTIGEVRTIPRIPYTTWAQDPSIGEQVRGS
ncbi:NADH-FMN oxidoreductase RutF, flavin reductase (DIM6/NTAB) family [Geodermatophilus dictyosporus]|uniref:NADH-FMN oxidoreductase RutF, flavin reductase (DIM6/NTAB) family n=1 Tax=Geodermatophilus dictyosporus TaxID=1523247 RepID=A0A1I5PNZ3_9ACTN|nr:flavin reductase family protein [Geodermatophilus dictyosporus]SFP35221.1 NADH-FMN oxidoreductase RutF, flavin reductase (DIM6/NTAB) family [Geodermatophilus dictyosporus]